MRGGVVFVEISFEVEEDETRLSVAHREFKGRIRWELFDDQLAQGRLQRPGKVRSVSRDEPNRPKLRGRGKRR